MSEDEVLPQASYTAEGKERIRLWRNDLADLAKDAGAHAVPTNFRPQQHLVCCCMHAHVAEVDRPAEQQYHV